MEMLGDGGLKRPRPSLGCSAIGGGGGGGGDDVDKLRLEWSAILKCIFN